MSNIPKHIAIIMDGNGRWAKARNLPRTMGHQRGVEAVKRVVKEAGELGVQYVTLFGVFDRELGASGGRDQGIDAPVAHVSAVGNGGTAFQQCTDAGDRAPRAA